MLRLVLRLVVLAAIIWAVTELVPGIVVTGGVGTYLWIAVLFSVVNAIVGTVLRIVGLPLIVVTLGLFLLVINAALLALTAELTSKMTIDGFWTAVLGGLLISVFSLLAEMILPIGKKRGKGALRS